MKTTNFLAALAAVLPHAGAQLHQVPVQQQDLFADQRALDLSVTIQFDDCVGQTTDQCLAIIEEQVAANPGLFDGLSALTPDVRQIRDAGSPDYYKVGLRTDINETHVVGVMDDGMIWYPWLWCEAEPVGCITVGPWDCDVGEPLSVEQCCKMITDTVPSPDVNGNLLECFVDPPLGSPSNPIQPDRVIIHSNADDIVVHPPIKG